MSTMTERKTRSSFVLRRLPATRTNGHVDTSPAQPIADRLPQHADDKIPPQTAPESNEPAAQDLPANATPAPNQTKTVSVKEAAFRLHKSCDSVYAWLRRGRLIGWQPGGPGCQIQVVESSIEQALKRSPGPSVVLTQAV